jgi:hypothetical protein
VQRTCKCFEEHSDGVVNVALHEVKLSQMHERRVMLVELQCLHRGRCVLSCVCVCACVCVCVCACVRACECVSEWAVHMCMRVDTITCMCMCECTMNVFAVRACLHKWTWRKHMCVCDDGSGVWRTYVRVCVCVVWAWR